jgi:hypothetical protein
MRSTTLRMMERHCAHALELYEHGHRGDTSATEAGTAAHSLIHAAGMEADRLDRALTESERHDLARAVMVKLTTEGRSFDGVPEPPLSLPSVQRGLALALDWIAEHGEQAGEYELPLAMNMHGKAVPYGPGAWYRGVLDHTHVESQLEIVRVLRDYKSYYSAGYPELRGIQLRGQAVLADANGLLDDCDELRLEVANLQTKAIVSEVLYLRHATGRETLDRWRLNLVRIIEGLERQRGPNGELPASPGPRCHGCPFIGICEAAGEYLASEGLPPTKEERARLYGVLEARRKQVRNALKGDAATMPVEVEGKILGFHSELVHKPAELIGQRLASEWAGSGGDAPGLIYALKLTGANLRAVAKRLFPKQREEQEAWLKPLLRPAWRTKFDWRNVEDEALLGPPVDEEEDGDAQ